MAHRLLTPHVSRMEHPARLPLVQHLTTAITDNLQRSMMTRDSLRMVKTTGRRTCFSPLAPVQVFAMSGPGYPNTPESMRNGLRIKNAPQLAASTRGQSAGI